ncbi:hypothetical protein [Mycoplasma phocoeninasale]|uniref:hypothetical protein n=1 Tax=Mycoplasma phocoeninasale TaxID=2726117 RepID=UPI0019684E06|nr:hypothetical protein [Mycoplasma phocoeninasale]MBN0970941.1 hypothetical protein [Mycoplasma phocoeninasale]
MQNETSENKTIDNFFNHLFISILTDKFDSDRKHNLLFSLISANLGKSKEEQNDYAKGLQTLSLAYLAKQNLFDSANISKLINEKNRESITLLLSNLVKNDNGELTENGRNFITNITSSVLEKEIQDPASNFNTLLKQISFLAINPISAALKTTFGENIQINGESVGVFVEKIWDDLWSQIRNKEFSNDLKNLISKILERGHQYETSSIHSFIISLLKDVKNNKLLNLVSGLVKRILSSDEIVNNVVLGSLSVFEQSAKIELSSEKKQLISSYLASLIKNISDSKLYVFAKAKLESSLSKIDESKQKNFENLGTYLKTSMAELFSSQNTTLSGEILDLLFVKNLNNEQKFPFNQTIKVFAAILGEDKIVDFALSKFDVKNLIDKLISNIKLDESLSADTQKSIREILDNLNVFIKENFDSKILPLVKELLKEFFATNESKNFNSLPELMKEFVVKNKDKLKGKINDLIVTLTKDNNLKTSLSKLTTSLITDNIPGFNWGSGRETLESSIAKLVDILPNLGLTDVILATLFSNIEDNLVNHQLDVNKYTFTIKFTTIINSISFNDLISFIKKLNSNEIKNLALLALKNLKHILKLRATPTAVNATNLSQTTTLSNRFKFSFKGEITVPLENWLDLFKASFSILDENDKTEIKNSLNKEINDLFNNQEAKKFISFKLSSILNSLVEKANPNNKIWANLLESMVNGLFEGDSHKNLIIKVSKWFIELDSTKLGKFKSINDITKEFLQDNSNEIGNSLKSIFKSLLGKEQNVQNFVGYILDFVEKEYKFASTRNQKQNIQTILTKVITSFNKTNIIDNLITKVLDKFKEIDFFDGNKINNEKLLQNIRNQFAEYDILDIFTEDAFKNLFESIIKEGNEINSDQLFSMYEYLSTNLAKLQAPKANNDAIGSEQPLLKTVANSASNFKTNIEKVIVNFVNALKEFLKKDDEKTKKFKNTVVETITKVLDDQVQKFDFSKLENKYISSENLKKIITKISKYGEVKNVITNLINDFTNSNYKGDSKNKLGEFISSSIESSKSNLVNSLDEIIIKIANDNEIKDILIKEMFKNLKINGNEDDKTFISNFFKKVITLLKVSELKKGFYERIFDLASGNAKSFDILSPATLINETLKGLTSIVSLNDFSSLVDFLGDGNDKINGADIVNLINLFLGKSENPDSFIYKMLNSINNDPIVENRTNLTSLNELILGKKEGKMVKTNVLDSKSKPFDPLTILNKIFELLNKEMNKEAQNYPEYNDKYSIRYDKPVYQATYRFLVTIKLVIFEMFGRETLNSKRESGLIGLYTSNTAILWILQEGVSSFISLLTNKTIGMQNYFRNENIRREFTNYAISSSFFSGTTYFNEDNYDPSSIDYLIVTSGYNEMDDIIKDAKNNNLTRFKHKITKNGKAYDVTKKEYILITIKEGGFAKFMKLNNAKSGSKWSKLNTVDFDKLEIK